MHNNLTITYVPITKLKSAAYNPRTHSQEMLDQLTRSIEQYGCIDPIIANGHAKRKNVVIGGHARLKAARAMGMTTVPVVYLDIPSLAAEKKLNLSLNRIAGDWDWERLKSFDIATLLATGFDADDLDHIWSDVLETAEDDFDVAKELKKIKKPQTKLGDMFQLGPHRLICGDAHDPAVIKRLMKKQAADVIYCDPVYNIKIDYNKGVGGKQQYGGTVNDNKSDHEYELFLSKGLDNALSVAKRDCHIFYYCDQSYVWLVQQLFTKFGLTNRRVCLWIKNGQLPTPNVAFSKCYEPCVYATRGKPYLAKTQLKFNEILNKEIGTGNRISDDILDMLDIWLAKRLSGNEYEHATSKPVTLHEKPLRRCTKPGDVVLDLYLGSGSTLLACQQMKRVCYGVELEPVFCDLIIKRFETHANKQVKKINYARAGCCPGQAPPDVR